MKGAIYLAYYGEDIICLFGKANEIVQRNYTKQASVLRIATEESRYIKVFVVHVPVRYFKLLKWKLSLRILRDTEINHASK